LALVRTSKRFQFKRASRSLVAACPNPSNRGAGTATRLLVLILAILCTGAALSEASARAAIESPLPEGPGLCRPGVFGMELTSETCAATLLNGRALAPPNAPPRVKAVISAANRIDHQPYVWGGGHLNWISRGYDCSGSVSFALHGAGLLNTPLVSGQLAQWGLPGVGRWITIYANSEHVYMVIAGLRYDTREDPPGASGPRWHQQMVPSSGFVTRHPAGL
jgi:cell wall-associated NlpC family hydrolase